MLFYWNLFHANGSDASQTNATIYNKIEIVHYYSCCDKAPGWGFPWHTFSSGDQPSQPFRAVFMPEVELTGTLPLNLYKFSNARNENAPTSPNESM
jgi:hypothetical protein